MSTFRWNNKNKSNSSDGLKPPRKNSNPMQNFPSIIQTGPQQPVSQMFYHATLNNNNNNNNNYNKSASYPNFAPTANSTISCNAAALTDSVQRSLLAFGQPRPKPVTQQQQQPVVNPPNCTSAAVAVAQAQESLSSLVYRHSLTNFTSLQQIQNNLVAHSGVSSTGLSGTGMGVQKSASTTTNITSLPPLFSQIEPVGCVSIANNSCNGAGTGGNSAGVVNCENSRSNDVGQLTNTSLNNSVGDINSRLEFLCLQMTEQAID